MRWAHLVSQLTSPKKNVTSQAPGSARRLFSQENLFFFSNKKNWTFQKNNCTPLWWGYQFSSLTPLQFQSMLSWPSQKFYIFFIEPPGNPPQILAYPLKFQILLLSPLPGILHLISSIRALKNLSVTKLFKFIVRAYLTLCNYFWTKWTWKNTYPYIVCDLMNVVWTRIIRFKKKFQDPDIVRY